MEKEKISSGNIIDFNVLKRILQFVKPYRGRFIFLIFLTVILGVLTPLRPLLIQYTLDNDVANGDYTG
ncbi:MAG TPA: antibiotic ABC transporter ATP-binding protein, partial [Cytophagales bacterium]|nr:antibiotic ABC transporter ATP-binding protein [Cytophagales bacterium]